MKLRCLVPVTVFAAWALACAPSADKPSSDEPAQPAEVAKSQEMTEPAELSLLDPPAGPGALAPRLSRFGDKIWLSWLEPTDEGHRLLASQLAVQPQNTLEGTVEAAWGDVQEIQRGADFFANWADVPGVADGADGQLFAHALRKLGEGTYAYGAFLSQSAGDGAWRSAGLLHDDDSATEHGFVSYLHEEEGLRAFWLDGRAMLGGGSMHLRTARLESDGAAASEALDERVCECCSTDAALTSNGPIVAYRDRSEHEIRDIAVIRATADGWSEPSIVHDDGWEIFGCPVNGPVLAADGELVALAWYTGAHDEAKVQLAFSTDAGQSFGAPVKIDSDAPLGRVDVELIDGDAYVSWLGSRGEDGEIRLRRVSRNGELGPTKIVAETSQARAAGVPTMTRLGDGLLVAWVELGPDQEHPDRGARLRAAHISLEL